MIFLQLPITDDFENANLIEEKLEPLFTFFNENENKINISCNQIPLFKH